MLSQLYELYSDMFTLPRTVNPIKAVQRKIFRDELYRLISEELDRRIASKI